MSRPCPFFPQPGSGGGGVGEGEGGRGEEGGGERRGGRGEGGQGGDQVYVKCLYGEHGNAYF